MLIDHIWCMPATRLHYVLLKLQVGVCLPIKLILIQFKNYHFEYHHCKWENANGIVNSAYDIQDFPLSVFHFKHPKVEHTQSLQAEVVIVL